MMRNFVEWGHHPDDPQEEKLKKSSLLVVTGPFAIAGIIWGLIYFSNGLMVPGSIPFVYGILSIANIISFKFSKKYTLFRNSQLFLILILPFALQISLGGFVPSSAVMYWAIVAPAGAMFFDSIKRSVYWFIAYLLLVIVAYLINHILPNYINWDLSEGFINSLFLMNILGVSLLIFGILYYFVSTITQLNKDIEGKNDALREQSEKLKELDEIKSRFFANLSHEFRTPLTLILGLANKQIRHPERPTILKESRTIKNNADRLLQLINQLLDLSKLESGAIKLQVSKHDIVQYSKICTAQFESMAENKQVSLTFNGRKVGAEFSTQTVEIYFDQEKLKKILTNLLSNAVKFTPQEGHISVEVEEKLDTVRNMPMVSIQVSNSGDEIPQDKLPYLFDRFYQVDSASNREYEGTGIGLALVKELVELHEGSVKVASKMHKTTFSLELPMNVETSQGVEILTAQPIERTTPEIDEIPPEVSTVPNEESEASQNQEKNLLEVLVVEDNADLRAFIIDILNKDYKVIEAVDGLDGLEKAETHIPDLIISDVMMPKMDGYDLCKQLKSNEKTNHIPLILLTAKASRENRIEGLERGADDYLLKPFDEEELKLRIKNLISIREKLQQKFQSEIKLKPKQVAVSSIHQKFLEDIKEVIEKNIDNELFSVDDLGKEIGMSRSQIHRKLKALTDQSATKFIRNYRLYRAAELLKQEVGNITDIAYQVGFNSQTYFSSSFQELFGCSPSVYKQQTP